jgi:hypothetical protein
MEEEEVRRFADRAESHLFGIFDGTLVLLKGQMLVEEALFRFVAAKCTDVSYLERAGLSYFRMLCVARAMHEIETADDERRAFIDSIWDAAEALNTLRNKLAHKLEPGDLMPLLKRLGAKQLNSPTLDDPTVIQGIRSALAQVLGVITAWTADSVKDRKDARAG